MPAATTTSASAAVTFVRQRYGAAMQVRRRFDGNCVLCARPLAGHEEPVRIRGALAHPSCALRPVRRVGTNAVSLTGRFTRRPDPARSPHAGG